MSVLPFPSAPDDPFTHRLGASPPPSPFRAAAGAPPPVLVGRTQALQAAADLLAGLGEQRSRAIGLHGATGMGKTALLDHIETQVVARGGVVVRLDGSKLDDAAGQLGQTRDQLLAAVDPSVAAGIDPGAWIAGTYQAAAAAARAARRALVVMVDDLNTIDQAAAELSAAHDLVAARDGGTGGLIMAGVHRHAGMAGVPAGLQSIPLGYLQPLEARRALTMVADRHGVALDPAGLDLAVQRAGGLPVAVQAWGDALWQAAHTAPPVNLARVEAIAEARLGRYYAKIWSALSDHDRGYIAAIANEFGGAVPAGDAAKRAGYHSAQAVSPLRAKLIDQGILEAPQRGYIAIAIAGFGRWYTNTRHTKTSTDASTRAPSHTPPPRTMAADQATPYRPRR